MDWGPNPARLGALKGHHHLAIDQPNTGYGVASSVGFLQSKSFHRSHKALVAAERKDGKAGHGSQDKRGREQPE